MAKAKQPPGPPMMLGNMRHLGVHHLIATCLSDACRHQGLIDVSTYPADTEVPWFSNKMVCAKCRARGRHIHVRPNWKEQPPRPSPARSGDKEGKQQALTEQRPPEPNIISEAEARERARRPLPLP